MDIHDCVVAHNMGGLVLASLKQGNLYHIHRLEFIYGFDLDSGRWKPSYIGEGIFLGCRYVNRAEASEIAGEYDDAFIEYHFLIAGQVVNLRDSGGEQLLVWNVIV